MDIARVTCSGGAGAVGAGRGDSGAGELCVLFVFSVERTGGGAVRVWLDLLDGLAQRGVVAHVVVPKGGDGTVKLELAKRGIPCTELRYTWWVTRDAHPRSLKRRFMRAGAGVLNGRAEDALAHLIYNESIDLVYICDGTICTGLRAARKAGIPVVWHFHQYLRGAVDGWSFIDAPGRVAHALRQADRVLTVTHGQRGYLLQRFGLAPASVEALYNGVRRFAEGGRDGRYTQDGQGRGESRGCEGSRGCPEGADMGVLREPTVTFALAGRVDANKRQADAVAAFELVAAEYPQARLVLAGTGASAEVRALEARIEASPCGHLISYLGFVEDMDGLWARTDVVLNCSASEGCSMVLAEGMTAGCLALASTASGNVELMDPVPADSRLPAGVHGLLYECGNVQDLAGQMRWVLANRKAALEIAERGRRFAQAAFSPERQIARVREILGELCATW